MVRVEKFLWWSLNTKSVCKCLGLNFRAMLEICAVEQYERVVAFVFKVYINAFGLLNCALHTNLLGI